MDAVQALYPQKNSQKVVDHGVKVWIPSVTPMRMTRAAIPSPLKRHLIMALALLLAASMAGALQAMPRAQRHENRHEIDQLEHNWREAMRHRDTAAMSHLLAEDFLAITPNGLLQTKAETLAAMRNGTLIVHSIDILEQRVRFFGKTAVVTSKARVRATTPRGDSTGDYRYTRVYARDPRGSWRIVSFEASRIQPRMQHR